MPDVVFSVDQAKSMRDQAVPGHNRWHPDIPPAVTVRPGSTIRVECREWTDGQIGNNDSANDVRDVDLRGAHMLSGPDRDRGRRAGRPARRRHPRPRPGAAGDRSDAPGQGWGYTGIFSKQNGGGFLTDTFPDAYKAIWDFSGQKCTSRHIPGGQLHRHHPPRPVRHRAVAGAAGALERPRARADRHRPGPGARRSRCRRWRTRCSAAPPPATRWPASAATARAPCRPRENGGNHDIKNFTRGSRVFYPVHVPGRPVLRRRPALQPGRRRDHVLRRDRDGRVHRLPRRPDQGRDGDLRRHHEPDPHARQRRAAVLGVRHVHRHRRRPHDRHPALQRRHRRLPQRVPQRRRRTCRSSATPARRPTCCSGRRRSRAGSAAWSTSRTPAARSTCPPRSSTSTSGRRRPARSARTAAAAR